MHGAVGMCLGGTTGDRYKLQKNLGAGAFGDAWQAVDRDEAAIVAVKLLDPKTKPDDVLREAQLHRRLSEHPRIVSMRNVELGANPTSFVVTELMPGGSIKDIIRSRRPTIVETHRWLRDVLEALSHAHSLHVLHRDVKPSNVLLGADGRARLTDFGISEDSVRRLATEPGMYSLTLPPEFGSRRTDERTDIWLVGLMGWQLLVGQRPDLAKAHAGTLDLAHRHSPEVPLAMAKAIAAAIAPDPDDRPQSADRLSDLLGKVTPAAGWADVAPSDPAIHRAWEADEAGGRVVVEIRTMARGGYSIAAHAAKGSRLSSRRDERAPTLAAATQCARRWLLAVVEGQRL